MTEVNISFEKLLDYFFYTYSYKVYLQHIERFRNPAYFYKHNVDIENYELSFEECKEYILRYDERYSFIFNEYNLIQNPENISKKDHKRLELLVHENKKDIYCLGAYLIYEYNTGNLGLEPFYKRLLELDPGNPYFSARYARYQASCLFKLYDRSKIQLVNAEKNLLGAIRTLHSLYGKNTPSFIYWWLGILYTEGNDLEKAELLFDKSITINNSLDFRQSEPFIWKAFVLNKKQQYKESSVILNEIMIDSKINDKKDFRFYKVLSDNYLSIGDIIKAKKYLNIVIEKYLEQNKFTYISQTDLLSLDNITLHFHDYVLENAYKSFLQYNHKNIQSQIDSIIFSLAFLYIENQKYKFKFLNTRGVDLLCFKYLQAVYETE